MLTIVRADRERPDLLKGKVTCCHELKMLAHDREGIYRELLHRGREDCVTIVSMDRDKVSSS